MCNSKRGEIVTILTIGGAIVITLASLVSSFLTKNKQVSQSSAGPDCSFHVEVNAYADPGTNGGKNFNNHVTFYPDGQVGGDVVLYRDGSFVAGPNGWNGKGSFDYEPQHTGGTLGINKGGSVTVTYKGEVRNCASDVKTSEVTCTISVDVNGNPIITGSKCNAKNFTPGGGGGGGGNGYCKDQSGNNAEACANLNKCDIVGGCNPACCVVNADCPNSQTCGTGIGAYNGYCKSNKSCDPNPTATPKPNATATSAPNPTATPKPNATATAAPNATNTPVPTAVPTQIPGPGCNPAGVQCTTKQVGYCATSCGSSYQCESNYQSPNYNTCVYVAPTLVPTQSSGGCNAPGSNCKDRDANFCKNSCGTNFICQTSYFSASYNECIEVKPPTYTPIPPKTGATTPQTGATSPQTPQNPPNQPICCGCHSVQIDGICVADASQCGGTENCPQPTYDPAKSDMTSKGELKVNIEAMNMLDMNLRLKFFWLDLTHNGSKYSGSRSVSGNKITYVFKDLPRFELGGSQIKYDLDAGYREQFVDGWYETKFIDTQVAFRADTTSIDMPPVQVDFNGKLVKTFTITLQPSKKCSSLKLLKGAVTSVNQVPLINFPVNDIVVYDGVSGPGQPISTVAGLNFTNPISQVTIGALKLVCEDSVSGQGVLTLGEIPLNTKMVTPNEYNLNIIWPK